MFGEVRQEQLGGSPQYQSVVINRQPSQANAGINFTAPAFQRSYIPAPPPPPQVQLSGRVMMPYQAPQNLSNSMISPQMAAANPYFQYKDPTEAEKWQALSQINQKRAQDAYASGLWLQGAQNEAEAKRNLDYAARNPGNVKGAGIYGTTPQLGNGRNDFAGFLSREPELAQHWDPGFTRWAQGAVPRNQYMALTLPGDTQSGLNRGQGEFFMPARTLPPTSADIERTLKSQADQLRFLDPSRPDGFRDFGGNPMARYGPAMGTYDWIPNPYGPDTWAGKNLPPIIPSLPSPSHPQWIMDAERRMPQDVMEEIPRSLPMVPAESRPRPGYVPGVDPGIVDEFGRGLAEEIAANKARLKQQGYTGYEDDMPSSGDPYLDFWGPSNSFGEPPEIGASFGQLLGRRTAARNTLRRP